MTDYSKEDILRILNSKGSAILDYMAETSRHEKNNLITYSKNIFIPLTEICRNDCGYCNFKKSPEDPEAIILKTPEEVLNELKTAEKYGCKEALFTIGEDADTEEVVKKRLEQFGYDSMVDYIYGICRMTLEETALLPHTNAGNFTYDALKKLKEVNASMGMMLENSSERLMELPSHRKSPGKDPKLRRETIENAGKLKIPYTTGILIGIGETKEEIVDSLFDIKEIHEKYGHIQEIIIQNFTPTPDIEMHDSPEPSLLDMIRTVTAASLLFKDTDVSIQVPPNLNYDTAQVFLLCGCDDWGGVSPVSHDYVNPTSPWPTIDHLNSLTKDAGFRLVERLCIYDSYITDEWLNDKLKEKCLTLCEHRIQHD